jgi:exopolysaccharide biosynthesis polyprenyl glycosylphosphotransferase
LNKRVERILILLVDFITINLAWVSYYYFRVETGWFQMLFKPEFVVPMLVIYFYWLLIFAAIGMYRPWFAASRFDELSKLFKTTFLGVFVLFALIFFDDAGKQTSIHSTRFLIIIYWIILFLYVGFGRLLIRSFQRKLLVSGIGRRNTLVVGFNPKSVEIAEAIKRNPPLGLDVIGYVAVKEENVGKSGAGLKVISTLSEIEKLIADYNIKEIIISLESHENQEMLRVVSACDKMGVTIKIVPDLYQMISGQVKTASIYGFPLVEINPTLMTEWEKKLKRLMDIVASLILLIISLPIIIITAIFIRLESPGPIIYKQERVGLNGKLFKVLKFRSMVNDAEKTTGPVWAGKDDPRVTKTGKFIRKVRIDELPQMYNVLKGEMSLVGPRPERPKFVEQFAKEIPLYKRRLLVKPGLTGWAQIKHKYDETIEDVKTKLKYDLFYIENQSLRMDLKILFRTIFVVLLGKGHFEE